MRRTLLKLVKRGELLPSGKKFDVSVVDADGNRKQKKMEVLLPESREILGYLSVEDDGHVSHETLIQDHSASNEIRFMLEECSSCHDTKKDSDCPWTPETRALHLTSGTGNLAYLNPRWEEADWDEETVNRESS